MALTTWEKFKFGFKIVEVRLRFVFILVATMLAVGYWDTIMNYVDKYTRPPKAAQAAAASDIEYYCPMHPTVIRAEPGNCPICGMNLSKRKKGEKVKLPAGVQSRVQLSPYRVRLAGVETSKIDYQVLVREVRTVGLIDYDERKLAHITTRIAGRIDKLFVDFTGTTVDAGDRLAWVYSPELVSTEEEYLIALKGLKAAKEAGDEKQIERSRTLVESARKRMSLWNLSDAQIARIERVGKAETDVEILSPQKGTVIQRHVLAGQYVEQGAELYTVADLSVVWMKAKVYEADLGFIRVGQLAEIRAESYPETPFQGTVAFIAPLVDAATRTVDIRVDIPNQDLRLKPGMYVDATFRVPMGRVDTAMVAGPNGAAPAPPAPAGPAVYTCPMDPEVVSDKPGDCPKCGMHLVKKESAPAAAPVYVCPMHPAVVSDQPGKCPKCGMDLVKREAPVSSRLVWFCPMHPDILSDKPGSCSICGHAELGIPPAAPGAPVKTGETCPLHVEEKLGHDAVCPHCHMPGCYMQIEKQLAVPASAVVDTGTHKLVYLEREPGVYDALEIAVGARAGAFCPILDGLKAGDVVVTQGSFLIDAESRLSPAASAAYFGASGGKGEDKK